jgi:(S)-2-hydroxyglutarate dehydrogenase
MFDYAIVGGGIVDLATARSLSLRYPGAGVLVLEKESSWARHQTGHNSGVIHSGVYYKPGSLKARFSKEGAAALVEFCQEHGVAHEICGKVIVATERGEMERLAGIHRRGLENGLAVEKLGPEELKDLEPHASGVAALHVPSTGIVDYAGVARGFVKEVEESGGELRTGVAVQGISETTDGARVHTLAGTFEARVLVNCAGLQSDRLAAMAGLRTDVKIVPFRGEYYELKPHKRYLVKNLIYPVPDPAFPFLGVHFTRMVDGVVEAGPNAVLGFAREAYKKTTFDFKDLAEVLAYPAFWRLARSYWRTGAAEVFRSLSKRAFVRGLQRLVPEVERDDLFPAEAGVRAQALSRKGGLVDDFLIVEGRSSVHVLNAPSPAATASIPIGEYVADHVGRYVARS